MYIKIRFEIPMDSFMDIVWMKIFFGNLMIEGFFGFGEVRRGIYSFDCLV